MSDWLFMIASSMLGGQKGAEGGGQTQLIMMGLMVLFLVFFYFVVVRPQNKKKKEMENLLKNLQPGDRVVTIGGAHGKVISTKDDTVTIRVDDKAEITFDKNAIARVVDSQALAKKKENGKEKVTDENQDDKKDS